ncbi:reverse transcriptase domain-containing protein [Tanacetum coccineum]
MLRKDSQETNSYCFHPIAFGFISRFPIDPKAQEKTTFTCPLNGTFAYRCMPFWAYAMHLELPTMYDGKSSRHDRKNDGKCFLWMTFSVFVDSSLHAYPNFGTNVETVLGQRKNKHFQPIHYASKTMTEAQAHYTTTEKELLAVVYAFEKFRSYLVLSKSIVYTDHSAIKYLFAKKDAKPRLMRPGWGSFAPRI